MKEIFQPITMAEDSSTYYSIKDSLINIDFNKPQQASLFDYFSHIELINLETKDNVLIGNPAEIIHYQNRYFIFDRQQHRIFVFNDEGKFLFQINKRGHGPGEYAEIRSLLINPYTKNLDVFVVGSKGSIISYDISGKHVNTSRLFVHPAYFALNFIILNEKTYVFYLIIRKESNTFGIHYYDIEDNKILFQDYEADPFFATFISFSPRSHTPFYEYHGKWYFYHFADNVTYEIGPKSLIKAYTWGFGGRNFDAKNLNLPNDPASIRTLHTMYFQDQNNRYLMALIRLPNSLTDDCLIYDKSTGNCKYVKRFIETVDFLPRKVTNDYVLSWCYHGALENFVTEDMLTEVNRKKFKDLKKSKDEMNPIIIKYHFK